MEKPVAEEPRTGNQSGGVGACRSGQPERAACPACGGRLVEIRAKLVCERCRTICETCCEGGPG